MISDFRYWCHSRKHKPEHVLKWPDLPVKHLVYFRDHPKEGAYIVFVDYVGDLDWRRDDKAEECTREASCDCHVNEIQNEVSSLEPLVRNWPIDVKFSAKRLLGESLARAFRCDYKNALHALDKARAFIQAKSAEVSRFWALQACTASASVAVILGVTAIWQSEVIVRVFGRTSYHLFLAACSGALGALLSVILRLGTLSFDASAERRLHHAEGVARIIAGSISGILVGALVKLGVLLPVFSKADLTTTAICTAALIAGASERLAPTIIAKMESTDTLTLTNGGSA